MKKNNNIDIKASLEGMFSYGNTFLIICFATILGLFIFCVKNFSKLPYPQIVFSILGLTFILLMMTAVIKIWTSKGEAGPPRFILKDGGRSLTITNYILAINIIEQLLPKPLPPPDALIEGKATEQKMKELTVKEKDEWRDSDEKEMLAQILNHLKKSSEKDKSTEDAVVVEAK
jgi:hypothetical protein